ncbi:50S ribosomal protein L13 [bacterium]|nr:50S ribosomal protein L13 [bacterium]
MVNLPRKWWVIDAEGLALGRLSSKIASVLRGKHKECYTPFWDCGDFIVIINAEKVMLTGNKMDQKVYYRHTGYIGGLKETSVKRMLENHPDRIIKTAVKGMLPKNRLGRKMITKLKIYAGNEHPHGAQAPAVMEL